MKGGGAELVKEAGGGNVKKQDLRPDGTGAGRIQGARNEEDILEVGERRIRWR